MDFLDRIDDLSDAIQATSILSLIGQGSERMAEIASRTVGVQAERRGMSGAVRNISRGSLLG